MVKYTRRKRRFRNGEIYTRGKRRFRNGEIHEEKEKV